MMLPRKTMVSGLAGGIIILIGAASASAVADSSHGSSPQLIRVAEYADRPSRVVDPTDDLRFNLVGELYRLRVINSGRTGEITIGSSVLVGPCTIASVFHVVAGADIVPQADKTYQMIFNGGRGNQDGVFAGSTTAVAVRWRETNPKQHDGIVLMQLKNCVGTLPSYGWIDVTTRSLDMIGDAHQEVRVIGYSDQDRRGLLHMGDGHIEGYDANTGMLRHSASADNHGSGGAVIGVEGGKIVLLGLDQGDEFNINRDQPTQKLPRWRKGYSGIAIPAFGLRNWPEGMAWIEDDIARFGKPNPAEARLREPLPAMPSASGPIHSTSTL